MNSKWLVAVRMPCQLARTYPMIPNTEQSGTKATEGEKRKSTCLRQTVIRRSCRKVSNILSLQNFFMLMCDVYNFSMIVEFQ